MMEKSFLTGSSFSIFIKIIYIERKIIPIKKEKKKSYTLKEPPTNQLTGKKHVSTCKLPKNFLFVFSLISNNAPFTKKRISTRNHKTYKNCE